MSLARYGFGKVIVLVGGIPINGFTEGDDVVQLARRNPSFALEVGADGNGAGSLSEDRSGTILLRLQQTSDSHTFLNLQFGLLERGAIPSLPFILKDAGNLIQLASAAHCLIEKPADAPFGTAVNVREWTLVTEHLVLV